MTDGRSTLKTVLLVFILCVVADFVWGYIRGRSIPAAITSVFFGVFGTAFYFFLFFRPKKDKEESRR